MDVFLYHIREISARLGVAFGEAWVIRGSARADPPRRQKNIFGFGGRA